MTRLREFRVRAGLTQEQLATAMGITQAAVCEWEAGRCMPEAKRLVRLASTLGVTIDDLMRPSDDAQQTAVA